MNDNFQPATVQAIQALYDANPHAKKLFDWTASLKKDASETSLERLMSVLDISQSLLLPWLKSLKQLDAATSSWGERVPDLASNGAIAV